MEARDAANEAETSPEIAEALRALEGASPLRIAGRVTEAVGLLVRATVPDVRIGDLVTLQAGLDERAAERSRLQAEVVGFRGEQVVLMPLGTLTGIGPDAVATPTGHRLTVEVGDGLLGRVLDGLGQPIDGQGVIVGKTEAWPVERHAPDPLSRRRVRRPLALGVRAIDGFLTVGEGQRVGLFAGAGVGKSLLLGQIARHAETDVNVICLVGERGREVNEFLEDALAGTGRARSVVLCATSDAPCLVRLKAALVATAIAEWFRDRGKRVLLLMDSLTRVARAQREVGLAAGEMPVRQGYPPSVFAMLPQLLERAGNSDRGSITAMYTVLVAGADLDEPIADEARAILDGHIVLSRALAECNHWPAVDVLPSLSRVMTFVADPEHVQAAGRVREWMATYEQKRDLISIGAYKPGSDARVDRAMAKIDAINAFLRQGLAESSPMDETRRRLLALL
jgi:ATP synthase in type III secretion protein N